jgi:O-antigen/teichoic acid export membrane protein
MRRLRSLFTINPVSSAGASAAAYVPALVAARGLAFLRFLIIARVLGDAGKHEFGLYRPALEFMNLLVAVVMFGAADVAERYVAWVERDRGRRGLSAFLRRQAGRLLAAGGAVGAGVVVAAPWLGVQIWGERATPLLAACAGTVVLLAMYQYAAAVLRGLRAYAAAAAMELLSAVLLLVFSAFAALAGSALALVLAYAASVFVPLALYAGALLVYVRAGPQAAAPPPAGHRPAGPQPHLTRFGRWALVRLLLVMLFGFLSLWGVRYLAAAGAPVGGGAAAGDAKEALRTTGDFAMTYTLAQLLAYVAVTLWSSTYGLAAAAWSHGRRRRARAQLFRVGKFGGTLMVLCAAGLLLTRGLVAALLPPSYGDALMTLLPGLLALFVWYGFLTFASTYADLQEKPQRGALLWAVAVGVQAAGIAAGRPYGPGWVGDARAYMMGVSAGGLAAALFFLAPALVCRPVRFSAAGTPLAALALAPLSLLAPPWVVDWVAGPALLGTAVLLGVSGLLIRPVDRRAWRRFRATGKRAAGGRGR